MDLWNAFSFVRLLWLTLFVLVWATYSLGSEAKRILHPYAQRLLRYLVIGGFIMFPHTWWADSFAVLWIGRFFLAFFRSRYRTSVAITLSLSIYPLLSFLLFFSTAVFEHTIILPYVEGTILPRVRDGTTTPVVHTAVCSTYHMFDELSDPAEVHFNQTQAFCYLDAVREQLFGPDVRMNEAQKINAWVRKNLCAHESASSDNNNQQRVPPSRETFSNEYKTNLLLLSDLLAPSIWRWHSHWQPIANYVLESTQRLQSRLLSNTTSSTTAYELNIFDNLFAVDPVIYHLCTHTHALPCYWFFFRDELAAIFTTTWSPWLRYYRSSHSRALLIAAQDLHRSLCAFNLRLFAPNSRLVASLALIELVSYPLLALPFLPEHRFSPAVSALFRAGLEVNRTWLTNSSVGIAAAQEALGIDDETATWANLLLSRARDMMMVAEPGLVAEKALETLLGDESMSAATSTGNRVGATGRMEEEAAWIREVCRAEEFQLTFPARWHVGRNLLARETRTEGGGEWWSGRAEWEEGNERDKYFQREEPRDNRKVAGEAIVPLISSIGHLRAGAPLFPMSPGLMLDLQDCRPPHFWKIREDPKQSG